MRIGIGGHFVARYGVDEGIRRMADQGYTNIDYNLCNTEEGLYLLGDNELAEATEAIKGALEKYGMTVEQVHGPWRYPPMDESEEDRAERLEKMTRCMVIASLLGAKYMVIHPLMPFGANSPEHPERVYSINRELLLRLADFGASVGVTVCLENMPFRKHPIHTVEQICGIVEDIDHENLAVCFDTGHANLTGENVGDCVRRIGKEKLAVLHVHDNCGDADAHDIVYNGNIDWSEFAAALNDIKYGGVLNFEVKIARNGDESDECIREREVATIAAAKRLLRELGRE